MVQVYMNKSDFRGLGIAPNILEILDSLNFKEPTPIQYQCIPSGIEGKDMIGVAQTGTGKTLAFGVPMIQHCLPRHPRPLAPPHGDLLQIL